MIFSAHLIIVAMQQCVVALSHQLLIAVQTLNCKFSSFGIHGFLWELNQRRINNVEFSIPSNCRCDATVAKLSPIHLIDFVYMGECGGGFLSGVLQALGEPRRNIYIYAENCTMLHKEGLDTSASQLFGLLYPSDGPVYLVKRKCRKCSK